MKPKLTFLLALSPLILILSAISSSLLLGCAGTGIGGAGDTGAGDTKEIRLYKELARTRGKDAALHVNLAHHYLSVNRVEEAIASLETAVRLTPQAGMKEWEARFILGRVYAMTSQYKKAAFEWKRVLKLFPNHHRAKEGLEILEKIRRCDSLSNSQEHISCNKRLSEEIPSEWRH